MFYRECLGSCCESVLMDEWMLGEATENRNNEEEYETN